jgi:hypothetical protein
VALSSTTSRAVLPGLAAAALRDFACLYFGGAARLFFGGALAIFLIAAPAAFLLQALLIQAFPLEALALGALQGCLGLFLGLAQLVDLFLLMTRLILEHFALHVGAFAAHLDIDRTRAPLRTGELELRLRFAPQGDLARSRIALRFIMTVAAAQMRQELVLGILADHVFRAVDFDAGLIELLQQPIDRYLQHLSELSDGYICHTCS